MAQQVVDGRQVEVHLAGVLELEVVDLEVDDDEAPQAQVIEEKIEIEVLVADLEVILAADKGEAPAEFEEECAQAVEQASRCGARGPPGSSRVRQPGGRTSCALLRT